MGDMAAAGGSIRVGFMGDTGLHQGKCHCIWVSDPVPSLKQTYHTQELKMTSNITSVYPPLLLSIFP